MFSQTGKEGAHAKADSTVPASAIAPQQQTIVIHGQSGEDFHDEKDACLKASIHSYEIMEFADSPYIIFILKDLSLISLDCKSTSIARLPKKDMITKCAMQSIANQLLAAQAIPLVNLSFQAASGFYALRANPSEGSGFICSKNNGSPIHLVAVSSNQILVRLNRDNFSSKKEAFRKVFSELSIPEVTRAPVQAPSAPAPSPKK